MSKIFSFFDVRTLLGIVAVAMHLVPCAGQDKRPNVIFILADDLGYGEIGAYGQKKIRTPNLDRLAAEGMKFTRHYSGAPVCAPSRCVLMTGKHLGHAQIRGNIQAKKLDPKFTEGQTPLSADTVTFVSLLREAGYATGAMGKWGLGPVGSTGEPSRQGFDHFFGYNCQALAHSYYPEYLWSDGEKITLNQPPIPGRMNAVEAGGAFPEIYGKRHASKAILEEALRWLGERKADEPFFLYLPFTEPHVALQPPPEMVDEYPEEWDQDRPYRGGAGYLPTPRPRAAYAAMISNLDRSVGAVLDLLEKKGLKQNTVIVFTSDNGATHSAGGADVEFFDSVGGLKGKKGSVDEGGLRVPCLVRWPGKVAAGGENSAPGYFADWFPTILELAGVKPPAGLDLDGVSLTPELLGGSRKESRPPMVWVFPEYGGAAAVRFGDYAVLRSGLNKPKPTAWELYDVVKDPRQTRNLAAEHPELIQQGREILASQWGENAIFPVDRKKAFD